MICVANGLKIFVKGGKLNWYLNYAIEIYHNLF